MLRGGDHTDEPVLGDDLDRVLHGIQAELAADNRARGVVPPDDMRLFAQQRGGSRFAAEGATPEVLATLAAGGSVDPTALVGGMREVQRHGGAVNGNQVLADVWAARRGDSGAWGRLRKGWVEGNDTAGGFLVVPEQLPGYIEARRAAAPLRQRCSEFNVTSNEVWVVVEGDSVQVAHTAEAAQKLDSTGTVAQKVSTIHKVAGTTHLSDELLADSNGLVAQLVARQFGQAIGIAIDQAIIGGTGIGEPTGILNAAGVAHTPVDGQTGQALYASILKAMNRLAQRFYADNPTVVLHPRDAVIFDLATATGTGEFLFPGGLGAQLRNATVVVDANLPTSLGAGNDESVIIVGNVTAGAYFFNRQGLTIDSSQAPGFLTDETVYRGVERYGFAVVTPVAFEVLEGVQPV